MPSHGTSRHRRVGRLHFVSRQPTMASRLKGVVAYNDMLGRHVSHQVSSSHYHDDELPRAKRRKADTGELSMDRSDSESPLMLLNAFREEILDSQEDEDPDEGIDLHAGPSKQQLTELESTLAPVETDKEAIIEYELKRAA